MLTVQELHLSLDKYLQEINSNVYGNLLPEEKDIFLNDEVSEFVRIRLKEYETTKQGLDNIKELIKTSNQIVYKNDTKSVYTILPPDYFRMVRSDVLGVNYCGTFTKTEVAVSKYIVRYKLAVSNTDTEAYKSFKFTVGGVDIFTLATYYPNGLNAKELGYEVKWLAYEDINKVSGYKCYWEWYNGNFYSGELIIEKDTTFSLVVAAWTGGSGATIAATEVSLIKYTTDKDLVTIPSRIVTNEDLTNLNTSYFGKSQRKSITCTLLQDKAIFDLPQIPIDSLPSVNKTMIYQVTHIYIKKPSRISLSLNRNCELSANVLDVIARRCAAKIALVKGNQTGEILFKQNTLIE